LVFAHRKRYTISTTPTLNDELVQALDQQGNLPLRAIHPATGRTFFLVAEEHFQRLKPLLGIDPISMDEQRLQLEQMGNRAGWDDPQMDAYDQYDEYRNRAQP
jgi:hypothetical protein